MRCIVLSSTLAIACGPHDDPTQYLVFQHFTGAGVPDPSDPQGAHILVQPETDLATDFEAYVDHVTSLLGVAPTASRRLGFAIGPLGLDLDDQVLIDTIRAGYQAAEAKQVAVVFHLDVSHFWKLAHDDDGRLSDGTGALDVREWMDWNGTVAAAGQHPGSDDWQPNLLPAMCYTCPRVEALVDRVTAALAPALAEHPELLGGVIVGWEAGSDNPLGYHALSLAGYDATASLADLRHAQQQILHDYLARWTRGLAVAVPSDRIYTHVANCTQWDVDRGHCDPKMANGPDSLWEMFEDDAIGGVSDYADVDGLFDAVASAAAGRPWAMLEGTNVTVVPSDPGSPMFAPSDLSFETYLARMFDHGAQMADIFGVEQNNGVTPSANAEAVAAYRKFFAGQRLVE